MYPFQMVLQGSFRANIGVLFWACSKYERFGFWAEKILLNCFPGQANVVAGAATLAVATAAVGVEIAATIGSPLQRSVVHSQSPDCLRGIPQDLHVVARLQVGRVDPVEVLLECGAVVDSVPGNGQCRQAALVVGKRAQGPRGKVPEGDCGIV